MSDMEDDNPQFDEDDSAEEGLEKAIELLDRALDVITGLSPVDESYKAHEFVEETMKILRLVEDQLEDMRPELDFNQRYH